MRVGIVGSRGYIDPEGVREFVNSLPTNTVVVSGGAGGPDKWAARFAHERGLEVCVHYAAWDTYGKAAGPMRNARLVRDVDKLIAFWDGESRGTSDVVAKAEAAGKPVTVIRASRNSMR